MAAVKKDDVVSMFDSFKEFKETKNIDRTTLVRGELPQRSRKDIRKRRELRRYRKP